jgi:hypothetical protein
LQQGEVANNICVLESYGRSIEAITQWYVFSSYKTFLENSEKLHRRHQFLTTQEMEAEKNLSTTHANILLMPRAKTTFFSLTLTTKAEKLN